MKKKKKKVEKYWTKVTFSKFRNSSECLVLVLCLKLASRGNR